MKAIRLAIINLRMNLSNFLMISLLYLLLPLMISLFMSFTFSSISKEQNQAELKLQVIDEDNSNLSKTFIKALAGSPFIALVDLDNGDYEITFPKGFEDTQSNLDQDSLYPSLRNIDGGSSGEALLTDYINQLGSSMQSSLLTSRAILEANLSETDQALLETNLGTTTANLSGLFIQEHISSSSQDLAQAVTEQYATGFLSYILIMFAMAIPTSTKQAQKSGLYGRIHTSPSTKAELMLADFYSSWQLSFLILVLYIVVHRLVSGAFSGNLLIYILMMLVYSAFAIAIASLLNALVPNTNVMTVVFTLIMIVQVMSVSVGGMLTMGEESPVSRLLDRLRIDQLWIQSLERNREGLYGMHDIWVLLALAFATILCLWLATVRESHRKEVRL